MTSDTRMAELYQRMKKDIMNDVNCHRIGIVESFDASATTANIIIFDKFRKEGTDEESDHSILLNIPIIYSYGGYGGIFFPLKKGDFVHLNFNDRDIDGWYQNNIRQVPPTQGMHEIRFAVAYPCMIAPSAVKNWNGNSIVIRFINGGEIELNNNGVTIKKDQSTIEVTNSSVKVAKDQNTVEVKSNEISIESTQRIKIKNNIGEFNIDQLGLFQMKNQVASLHTLMLKILNDIKTLQIFVPSVNSDPNQPTGSVAPPSVTILDQSIAQLNQLLKP